MTVSPSGLLTCAGGKWTTYRQMAEDAVDEAVKTFDLKPKSGIAMPDISGHAESAFAWTTSGACKTRHVPLAGAHGFSTSLPAQLSSVHNLDADVAAHLATNYGDRAWDVVSSTASPTATARLVPAFPFVEGEIRHAIRAESAETATDVLARRTRLAFLDVHAALDALPRVVDVMAQELKWSPARAEREWTNCVQFLRSMGLPQEKMGVTRAQVLEGRHRAGATVGSTGETAKARITGGLPEQTLGGAVMARNSSS